MEILIQISGWAGMAIIVIAHILVSTDKLTGESKRYQLMNLIGSVFIAINVFHYRSWPAFTLQVVWGLIAIIDLINYASRPRRG
jgi:hypothetical protein